MSNPADIVERLREAAQVWAHPDGSAAIVPSAVCQEAATEIARLRGLCGRAAEQIDPGWADFGTDDGCECADCTAVRKAVALSTELREAAGDSK